ncbi:hypothetical protein N9N67_09930 [Bacteriovoracaceae bacterium]|nr:hypothetical protein [Bacteriovoracaceae bacterium]
MFNTLLKLTSFIILCSSVYAQEYKKIYPFTPPTTQSMNERISKLAEEKKPITSVFEIFEKKIESFHLKQVQKQPWASTFWPLLKGTVADPYNGKKYELFRLKKSFKWEKNYKIFLERQKNLYPKIMNGRVSQKVLNKLAPSEKYDILMGDSTFDFTNRLWDYTVAYGKKKYQSFVSKFYWDKAGIDFYNIDQWDFGTTNSKVKTWEGICHGWATAAGHVPRPKRYVDIKLKGANTGKTIRMYPEDIKALASLTWANSIVQDTAMTEGLRCNRGSPKKDKFGRYYDHKPDKFSKKYEPRCVGVHPALFHLSLVNILGNQKRSFVVERKIKAEIDNHPISGYSTTYFNVNTLEDGTLFDSTVKRTKYKKDPFKSFRNPDATHIVGVKMKLYYVDWMLPRRKDFDSFKDDDIVKKEMMYDLELDTAGNILGGQWRVAKRGKPLLGKASIFSKNNQPNFIWVIPRDWRKSFQNDSSVTKWNDTSVPPPSDWKHAALSKAHPFIYKEWALGPNGDVWKFCPMKNRLTGETKDVPCERSYNRPQPLYNFVNKLVEVSSGIDMLKE